MTAPPLEILRVHDAPAPSDPAVGVHWRIGSTVGLIPAPPWAGSGSCWACGEARIARHPPLCENCAWAIWRIDA